MCKGVKNDKYSVEVQKTIEELLPTTLKNLLENKTLTEEHTIKNNNNKKIINFVDLCDDDLDVKLKCIIPKGRKIQKIDPDNFNHIIKVYDSMTYLLRSPENKAYTKEGLQSAIKKNRLYDGFRWSFVEKGCDETIVNIEPTSSISGFYSGIILQLNDTKTAILESFPTKTAIAKKFGVELERITKCVANGTKFNGCFYVEHSKCPTELLEKYNRPLNKRIVVGAKQVQCTNQITGNIIVFHSLSDAAFKFGCSHETIKNAIKNNTLFKEYTWKYYNSDILNSMDDDYGDHPFDLKMLDSFMF